MTIEALIFDFDGTLAELNIDFDGMRERVRELAGARGWSGGWPGGYLLEEVEALARAMGNGFHEEAHRLIQEVELEAAGRGRLFPYTRPLLRAARQGGLKLAVISRNCGPAIRRVFPEVERMTDAFLPREAVVRTKPHPDHVLDALRALGSRPERSATVGDHPTDLEAALAAGTRAVGVASGRMGRDDLVRAGAHLVLPDAAGLLESLSLL